MLSVGRLAPHKRHDLVIRAFALFQQEFAPDARLLCAGEPISQAYLDQLTALAVRARRARTSSFRGRSTTTG